MTKEEAKQKIQEKLDQSIASIDVQVMMERLTELKESPSTVLKLQQQLISLAYFVWVSSKVAEMPDELADAIGKDLKVAEAHVAGLTLALGSQLSTKIGL